MRGSNGAAMEAATEHQLAEGERRGYVTLTVDGQMCGVPVLQVRDVLGEQTITRIPLAPPEVAGSLNLRGRVVTAIDLRRRLDLPGPPPGASRMSVVTDQGGELYALLVDQVSEVVELPTDSCEVPPPTLPAAWAAHCTGVFRLQDRLLVALDVSKLLALGTDA